jgi:hypothetical protein
MFVKSKATTKQLKRIVKIKRNSKEHTRGKHIGIPPRIALGGLNIACTRNNIFSLVKLHMEQDNNKTDIDHSSSNHHERKLELKFFKTIITHTERKTILIKTHIQNHIKLFTPNHH